MLQNLADIPLQDVEEMCAEARVEYDILAISRTTADVFRNGEWINAMRLDSPPQVVREDRQTIAPIPFPLFATLVRLPGKALAVYLGLWHRSRLLRLRTLTCAPWTTLGITPPQRTRALAALARQGLVTVTHRRRRPPRVTLRRDETPWCGEEPPP